ncbi:MAG TPA: adenylate kinase [Bacteroidetes bacterium]|nr:adenylate kinase [Bacteroidota bacterium]
MLNIILFGPPGSGKGTQAAMLKDQFNLLHISTGDIFRSEIAHQTPLGLEAKSYLDKGVLVPDDVTIRMLAGFVYEHTTELTRGIIFDGFPRTVPQAEALDHFLDNRRTPVTIVLSLEVDENELVRRLIKRGQTSGRTDDANEEVVRHRLHVYSEQTSPLKSFYDKQKKFVEINGVGSVDEIFNKLCEEINQLA